MKSKFAKGKVSHLLNISIFDNIVKQIKFFESKSCKKKTYFSLKYFVINHKNKTLHFF